MVDLDSLRDTLSKAQTKAKRLRAQADAAEKDASEIETAIRVIERMSGTATESVGAASVNETGSMILQYLGSGEGAGKSPKEVYDAISLMEGDTISADLVRTQLWRMAKRGVLESKDGRYWKPQKEEAPDARASEASVTTGPVTGRERGYPPSTPEGSIPSGSTHPQSSAFDEDLEDDVPF